MKKLTKEQTKEIQRLRNEGRTIESLAKEFCVSENTIIYWCTRREQVIKYQNDYFRNLPIEKRREIYQKKKPYFKEYFNKRYHEDEEFRRKHIERIIRSRNKK